MEFQATTPLAFALILLVAWVWWVSRKSYADLTPRRARALIGVRAAVVALVAVALADVALKWQQSDLPVSTAFCVDVSGSMSDAARSQAEAFIAESLKGKASDDRAGIIAFDGRATLAEPVSADVKAIKIERTGAPGRTNIAEAVRLAALSLPGETDRRIVLITDGEETDGNARAAAEEARRLGIRIDTFAPKSGDTVDVAVAALDVPAFVRRSQPFEVTVKLASAATAKATVKLFVDDMASPAQTHEVTLAGAGAAVAFPVEIDKEGNHFVKAVVEMPGDAVARNNTGSALVTVGPKPTVLVVASAAEDAGYIATALETHQFNLRVIPPTALPGYTATSTKADVRAAMTKLLQNDVVILSNVNAKNVTKEQQVLLNTYVYDFGGGLIMVGGKDSFGSGGWYKTPVEAALPVYTDPLKEAAVFAVVLIMDKSWSMGDPQKGDISKIDVVKEATIAAMEKLTRKDYLSVISFDTETHVILPMQRVEDAPKMAKEVSTMASFGLTNFYPALVDAEKALKNTVADYKHAVLISDGRPSGPGKDYEGQIEKMKNDKIVVSAIAVGVDADKKLMNNIAAWGKGQYYFTDKVETLPELMLKETGRMKELLLVEGAFAPRPGPRPYSPILKGLDIGAMPMVLGFNRSRAKETAQVEMIVSAKDEPLLASWRYGAGSSVAFLSDAKNVWCPQWVGPWEQGFSRFWRQMVLGALQIRKGDTDYRLTLTRGAERTEIALDAVDRLGRFVPGESLKASVTTASAEGAVGEAKAVELKPDAPGRYVASITADPSAAMLVRVLDKDAQEVFVDGGVSLAPSEYLTVGVNESLLDNVRKATAGEVAKPGDVFKRRDVSLAQARPFDVWLLSLAALLFAADVVIRRLPALLARISRGRIAA